MLDKRPGSIRAMFARIAPRYDLANRLLSMRQDVGWRKRISARLLDSPGRVLDVASGTGDLAADLLRFGGHRVVASDFTFEMLHAGRPRYERFGISPIAGDALALPFADDTFDGVTVSFGIRNFADPLAGLQEMRRVLREGGACGVLEFSHPHTPLRFVYRPYMRHVLPLLGGFISGSRAPYQYLVDSIDGFPEGERFVELMREAGFSSVERAPLSGGIATFYRGVK